MNPDIVRIKHMIDAANEILQFTAGKDRADLDSDRMLSLSIVHLLEIIGEASNKVSSDFQEKYNQVPWKAIAGMRNRLIHGYFDIDLDIVWTTVVTDISPLLTELIGILKLEEE